MPTSPTKIAPVLCKACEREDCLNCTATGGLPNPDLVMEEVRDEVCTHSCFPDRAGGKRPHLQPEKGTVRAKHPASTGG